MRPDWHTLPAVEGIPELRLVGAVAMTENQYRVEAWHFDERQDHEVDGRVVHSWQATLAGLAEWSRLAARRRRERIAIARTRNEQDEEFREYVDALHDAKPGGTR